MDVVNIFSTDKAFAALRADGSVVTWGDSSYGGDSSSVASKLDGTVDVVRLFSTKCGSSTSGGAFAALREDGSVVVWGAFSYGGGLYVGMETELHDVVDISHIGADWLSGLLESEPNGTFATANVIVFGEAITGQIATSDDLDVYMLTASEAGVASISFDAPTNSSLRDYFIVNVFDADGTVLSSQSAGKDFSFQTSLPEAGDYYVGINAGDWYHDAGQYNLTVTTKSLDNNGYEYEPNDEYANILVSGLVKRGKLATAYDIDRFQLQTTDAGSLTIHFDAPTTNTTISSYFYIHVFDEDANLLARRACNQDVDFEVNAPEAGNYVVEITHGAYYDPGEYALKVTETVGTVLRESEINDSQETADTMSLDESIHGQLSLFNDKDYFAFTMGASGNITIDFDGPSNSTWINYFAIELLDESGTLLASRDTGSDVSLETTVDAAGVYYIKIERSNDFHNDGEYRITVSAILDEPVPDNALKGTPFGDSITGTSGDDLIYGLGGNDLINGLDGSDTVVFRASSAHLSINTVQGLTTVRGDYGAGEYAYSVSRLWNVENLKTQSGTEALSSMSVTPLLGTVAGEVIRGTTADDLIDGLGGSDFIDGGEGNDTLALFGAKSHFMVLTVAGITRIQGSDATNEYAGHTLKTINVENLAFNQNQTCLLQTTSANKIFGTQSADRLTGTNGDDVFDGQGGNDQIDGGAGNDTIAIFGKMADFTMTYPSETDDRLLIQGKTGTPYARQTLTATNIESIAFVDNTIAVTNPPKVVLSPASLNVAEGGTTSSLSVALSAKPTSTVSVNINTGSQLSASSMQLTFDSTNWSTPQTVTVSAVDDATYEKQHSGMLTVSVQTSDSLYAGLTNSTLNYTISDNDTSNLGAVSGKFWNDFDKDGLMESRETALSGWTVFDDKNSNGKLDSGEVSGTTGLDGYYVLEDLTPGSHTIVAKVNNGWTPTYSNHSAASATIITNTGSDGEVSVETLSSEEVSETAAQETYSNLGRATNIAAYHADSRFADINGQGYSVVVIDTGIDLDHSYFGADSNHDGISDRIVYSYDFYGKDDNNASDGQGHGAHVAGIIGSSNVNFPGVAPEVNIIALKVFPDGDGGAFNYDIIQALNWVVQNTTRYNIAAVNLSLGDGQFNTTSTIGYCSSQLKSLANIGVTVVSASGNGYAEYQKQGVSYPSSDPYSLSVGAVWTGSGTWGSLQTGVPDAIAFFSQRDDELSDIFAPGVLIYSAENNGDVIQMSGTSMASPEIAGMVALGQQLAEQELGRRLTFNEVHDLLYQTGNDIVDGDDENDVVPNTGLTFKRVDMLAFAEAILELKPLVSQTVTITAGTTVIDKNFGFAATTDVQALGADDLIIGTTWGEIIRGGAGADQISSGDGDDELYGEDGNDLLKLEGGDNYVDGGNGFDIVQYAGVYADYHYSYDIATDTWTVQRAIDDSAEGTGNTDTITGMELFRFAGEEGDDDHPAEAHDCTVDVTYWKSGAAIEGVTSCLTDTGNDQERTCLTDGTGKSDFTGLIQAEYELEALKTVDDSLVDTVQVSDALAALKIAFGVNPNGGGSEVSNYEYIAADVNQDGTVKASDALAILKMAIGFNKAQEHEWLFVSDDIAEVVMSRTNVDWSEVALDITITSDTQIDLIGIVKGDVNGSWTPEAA
ncbi:S8 family serine peptidase [Chlorobaculum sp. 24CR]|uniref:S8 family serine peptidase n=1 Tax=Chlorobaculum sp. 24CR TaxID=2508878 RepID=UPI001AD9F984|nr:S8 family serine peptidase [Chlorobaculum sp. 24CR]